MRDSDEIAREIAKIYGGYDLLCAISDAIKADRCEVIEECALTLEHLADEQCCVSFIAEAIRAMAKEGCCDIISHMHAYI